MRLIKTNQFFIVILDGIVTYVRNLLAYRWLIYLIVAIGLSSSLAFLLLYFYSARYALPYTVTLKELTTNMPAFVLVSFFHLMLTILLVSFPLMLGYLPGFSLLNPRRLSAIYLGRSNKFSEVTIAFGTAFPGAFIVLSLYLFVANFPIFPTIVLLLLVAWTAIGFIVYTTLYRNKIKLVKRYLEKNNYNKRIMKTAKNQRLLYSALFYNESVKFAFWLTILASIAWIFIFLVFLSIAFEDDRRHEQIIVGMWAILMILYFPVLINFVHVHKILPIFGIGLIIFIYFLVAPGATWHTSTLMNKMYIGGQIPITITLKPDAVFNNWGNKYKQRQVYLILLGEKNIYVSEMNNYKCEEIKKYVKFETDSCQRTYSIPMNYVQSITMYAPRRE